LKLSTDAESREAVAAGAASAAGAAEAAFEGSVLSIGTARLASSAAFARRLNDMGNFSCWGPLSGRIALGEQVGNWSIIANCGFTWISESTGKPQGRTQ